MGSLFFYTGSRQMDALLNNVIIQHEFSGRYEFV